MAILTGFVGPTNVLSSTNLDGEDLINWYVDPAAPGQGKGVVELSPTPGCRPWLGLSLTSGPCRALFQQDGRAWAVGGSYFSEIYPSQTSTAIGSLGADGRPATIASNSSLAGHQLAISSTNTIWIFDLIANTLVDAMPGFVPGSVTFVDGYFVAPVAQTNKFRWSALEDGLTWPGLNIAQLSQSSDNIVSLTAVHGQLWILGSQTGVVWADTGDSQTFSPIPGSLMQVGNRAPASAVSVDNSLIWVGGNDQGDGIVFRGQGVGAVPARISTFAVEYWLGQSKLLNRAIGYTYQQWGHTFYELYVADLPWSFVFDASTNLWHKRALWNPALLRYEPDRLLYHMFAFGVHLMGDRASQAIYEVSPSFPTMFLAS